jgi:Arc/MetJ family transcription regulator
MRNARSPSPGWLSRVRSRKNPYASKLKKTVTVAVDDRLMQETLRATGLETKREAVELALHTVLRIKQQEEIRRFRGKLKWEGDMEETRTDARPVSDETHMALAQQMREELAGKKFEVTDIEQATERM